MVFVEFERRARRNAAQRIKLLVQMMTTAGYAGAGSALADPLFNGGPFGAVSTVSLGLGLAALASALYYVPQGEHDVLS